MAKKMGVKEVTKDKAVLNDGTILKMRDGSDLLDMYYSCAYDLLTTGSCDKTPLSGFVKKAYNKLEDSQFSTLQRLVKDTAGYYNNPNEDAELIEFKLSKRLFGWQKELLVDNAKKITLLCGRRAGKSFGEAGLAVKHCTKGYDKINGYKKPRSVAIIGLTVEKCADVFWQNVLLFAEVSGMKYKANNSKHEVTFENGAVITLFGNNSKTEREKIRGSEYSMIIIDEAQSQHSLEYLLTDILDPIITGRGSTVILSGTGSLTGYGKWADITTGEEAPLWRHYTATMEQNPTIPDYESALQRVLDEHHWTEDNLTFQREYLAKNVIDTTRMVFPNVHYYEKIPEDFVAVGSITGLDYGWSDYNAFAPVVFDKNFKCYLVKPSKFNHASVTDIVKQAKEIDDYINKTFKVRTIFVADTSDQSISREIYNQGIKIQNAYKVDVKMQINRLQEWLENGTLMIQKDGPVDKECKQTVWKWDSEKKCAIYEIDDDYFHPDIIHALRYAINTIRSKYKK